MDDWIAKSITYTINGPTLQLTSITNNEMRFRPGAINYVEYDITVLPQDVRAEQIKTLTDVEHLGGAILAVSTQGIPVGLPLQNTR
jgi:hypothetical protein